MKNDYEMTLNGESTIIPCEDGCDVPVMQFDFISIAELENRDKDAIVGKEQQRYTHAFLNPTCVVKYPNSCNRSFYQFLIMFLFEMKILNWARRPNHIYKDVAYCRDKNPHT